jgi:hypothetical protein
VLGRRESNSHWRVQSPQSCQLDDTPIDRYNDDLLCCIYGPGREWADSNHQSLIWSQKFFQLNYTPAKAKIGPTIALKALSVYK